MTTSTATAPHAACDTCALNSRALVQKLGFDVGDADYIVALAGNPNTGKSTVFNALTGLRQHVGNWTGKTVTRAEGGYTYGDHKYKIVDLPGTYSLLSTSADEQAARNFVLFGKPDVTVIVVDATHLERNLNLALQILEITDKVVVGLNLVDEAKRHGIEIDERHLSRELGVPVIPMAARRGQGIPELLAAIESVATGVYKTRPHRIQHRDPRLKEAVASVTEAIRREFPSLPNAEWVALRLIDGDPSIEQAIRDRSLGELQQESAIMLPVNVAQVPSAALAVS
jgi:ferrous iron transport protein B